jgi:rhomboid protease GluP
MAVIGAAGFALSFLLVEKHYSAYAAEVSFSTEGLLVDDSRIPQDTSVAKSEVEQWGKDHPRDPRVHLFRALRSLDEGNNQAGEAELRAALAERQILERAFGNKKLETSIVTILCELLVQEGRRDEAKREAAPVCKADDGVTPTGLSQLGLCE